MSAVETIRETVDLTVDDHGVAIVTLNRPDALNALNDQMKAELAELWRELANRRDARCVLLTGAGRAFSTGGDIKQMDPDRSLETSRLRMARLLREVVIPLYRLDKPVIAAVNGHAHGLGLGLALACDIAYASAGSSLSMAFVRIGLAPDGGVSFLLPRLVGLNRAKELMFTGRRLTAGEALELGLVNRVLPEDQLMPAAMELAVQLAEGPTVALAAAKRSLNAAPLASIEEIAELEAYGQAQAMASDDHREGRAAFAEKRAARFTGT